jgi:hypothetical protein
MFSNLPRFSSSSTQPEKSDKLLCRRRRRAYLSNLPRLLTSSTWYTGLVDEYLKSWKVLKVGPSVRSTSRRGKGLSFKPSKIFNILHSVYRPCGQVPQMLEGSQYRPFHFSY